MLKKYKIPKGSLIQVRLLTKSGEYSRGIMPITTIMDWYFSDDDVGFKAKDLKFLRVRLKSPIKINQYYVADSFYVDLDQCIPME